MRLPVLIAVLTLAVPGLASAADGVPTLDVNKSCRGGSDTKAALDSCMKSEADARAKLVANWSLYPADQRKVCFSEGGTELASYVEILTCLEMYKDLKTLPKDILDFGKQQKID
ncbi:MAG: hypothetical protein HXX10_14340 [Rhodoplanes sp.]|uniref:hypothetical protein n=1 Tax=Rhodoplanes sp. TaxID=1968906 RepID=UPI0017E5FC99|nr:hypothetical protein [Rhodoplanes sp.]NVO15210.1 hypothetical protein [Rhodoplanes sp.]